MVVSISPNGACTAFLILHFFLGENIAEAWNVMEKEGLSYAMFSDRCKMDDCPSASNENIQYNMDGFMTYFNVTHKITKLYEGLQWKNYPTGRFLKKYVPDYRNHEGIRCPKCNEFQAWRFLAQDHIDKCSGQ